MDQCLKQQGSCIGSSLISSDIYNIFPLKNDLNYSLHLLKKSKNARIHDKKQLSPDPISTPSSIPQGNHFTFFYYLIFEILWSSSLISHFSNIRCYLLVSYCDKTQFHSPTSLSTKLPIDSANFIVNSE